MPLLLPSPGFFAAAASNQSGILGLDQMLAEQLQRAARDTYTISGGAIAPAVGRVRLVPESGGIDQLGHISTEFVYDGAIIAVSTNANGDTVTLQHGLGDDGRINIGGRSNVDLTDPSQIVCLRLDGGIWEEIARSGSLAGGGGGASSGLPLAAVRTASWTLEVGDFGKKTLLDTTAGNITITVPAGLALPANAESYAFFEKKVAANTVSVVAAGGGDGSTPVMIASNSYGIGSGSATVNLTGSEAAFTGGHDFVIPAGDDVALFVDVYANYEDAAARTLTLKRDNGNVAWSNSDVQAATDTVSLYHYRVALGDLAGATTVSLKLATPGADMRSYIMFARAASGVNQSTPAEAVTVFVEPGGATSAVRSCTTLGANRNVFYSAARKGYNGSNATITNATSIAPFNPNATQNQGALNGVMGRENVASASTADATIGFSNTNKWGYMSYALVPTSGGGGVALKVPGGGAANITQINKSFALGYNPTAGDCAVAGI